MVLASTMNAFAFPVLGYIITQLQWTYYKAGIDPNWESDAKMYLIIMACWILLVGLVGMAEKVLFGVMGEKLTNTLRISLIDEIMHKQISWFDREDRAPGIITTIVSSNITSLNGMTSEVLVTIFELVVVCIVGIAMGAYFCWQTVILCVVLSPILVLGIYMMSTMQLGNKGGRDKNS